MLHLPKNPTEQVGFFVVPSRMTIDELKDFFKDKTFTPPIQISPDQIVSDPVQFLYTQFIMLDQWPAKKPLDRCPAYLRLMKFWEVVK